MFAELVTEAGPIAIPRAEATVTDNPDVYKFVWEDLPFTIASDTTIYARLYITREGGPCIGMAPMRTGHTHIDAGNHISLRWHVVISFGGLNDLDEDEDVQPQRHS